MSNATYFVLTITALQVGAAVAYGWQRRWPEVMYWASAASINVAFLWKVGV